MDIIAVACLLLAQPGGGRRPPLRNQCCISGTPEYHPGAMRCLTAKIPILLLFFLRIRTDVDLLTICAQPVRDWPIAHCTGSLDLVRIKVESREGFGMVLQ